MPAEEFFALARNFEESGVKVGSAVYDAFKATGEIYRDEWKSNAAAIFNDAAARFPTSITTETVVALGAVQVETGPENDARSQGFLGYILEFGGEHSPAYLTGLRSMSVAEHALDRLSDTAIAYSLP